MKMEFTTFLIVLSTFVIFISLYLLNFFLNFNTKNIGFKNHPIFGTLLDFVVNRHRFLDWSTQILSNHPTNTSVFYRTGKIHGVMTSNPEVVQHILKTRFENYPKGTHFITLLQDFLGNGIFNVDGESWRIQRKTASYEFNTKSLKSFVMKNVFVELKTRLIPVLEKASREDMVLDVQDILERFAFDNICKVAFNFDPGCLEGDGVVINGGEFVTAFDEATFLSSGRFMYAFRGLMEVKKFFNLGTEKRLRKSVSTVHEFADKIIRTRIKERVERKDEDQDLLSRFMGNSENSVEFLRDIVISFILAGRDTTSSALSWFFWLLSSNPDVEVKILKELKEIREKTGKLIGEVYDFDDLREMNYLQAAIMESMRLYPPVPVDTKACKNDDVLPDGTFIRKDWFITYHTYAMGRMKNNWGEDCCEYKPERWIENGICKQENQFKYPVFHAGPRMCLGKEMAYIQMKSIVACVLERFGFDVLLEKGIRPDYVLSLTLRMKGGLPVKVKERIM